MNTNKQTNKHSKLIIDVAALNHESQMKKAINRLSTFIKKYQAKLKKLGMKIELSKMFKNVVYGSGRWVAQFL